MSTTLTIDDKDGFPVRANFPNWRVLVQNKDATMESFRYYVNKGYHNTCQKSHCMYGDYCRLKDTGHTLECHQVADRFTYVPDTTELQCILPVGILSPIF